MKKLFIDTGVWMAFTDCTSFIVMKMLGINEVFSFDRHFEQYGFVRLPIL